MDFSHQESQQQIVEYNKQEEEGINLYLHNIENGQFDPALLENSEWVISYVTERNEYNRSDSTVRAIKY